MDRGRQFLGSSHAILGGAMTWVSEHNLVAAISNAGGFGVLASGAMPPHALQAEIQATQALTQKPFGVNLITLHPQLMDLIAVCREARVSHIVLAGGIPSTQAIQAIKAFQARLLCFTPTAALGKKLIRSGADALIIEGSEAGGHVGPVSTSVLAQEILPVLKAEAPIFVAGGIGRGEAMVSYLTMGAAGVQLGTRFVCAHESTAHPAFKKAFIRAQARDAITSVQLDSRFTVIPVRALKNKGMEDFYNKQREVIAHVNAGALDQTSGQLEIEHYWAGALRRAVVDGDIETGSLMAGQSVGMVEREEPVQAIVDALIAQAESYLSQKAA